MCKCIYFDMDYSCLQFMKTAFLGLDSTSSSSSIKRKTVTATSHESLVIEISQPLFQHATENMMKSKASKWRLNPCLSIRFDPLWVVTLWWSCIISNKAVICHKSRSVSLGLISKGAHGMPYIYICQQLNISSGDNMLYGNALCVQTLLQVEWQRLAL